MLNRILFNNITTFNLKSNKNTSRNQTLYIYAFIGRYFKNAAFVLRPSLKTALNGLLNGLKTIFAKFQTRHCKPQKTATCAFSASETHFDMFNSIYFFYFSNVHH